MTFIVSIALITVLFLPASGIWIAFQTGRPNVYKHNSCAGRRGADYK